MDQDSVLANMEDNGFLGTPHWREAAETPLQRQSNTTQEPDDFPMNAPDFYLPQEFETVFEHLDTGHMDTHGLTLATSDHDHDYGQMKDGITVSHTSSGSCFPSSQAVDLDEIQRCYFNPSPSITDAPSLVEDGFDPASNCGNQFTEAGGLGPLTPSLATALHSIRKRKTVLTIENLDPETRSTILNLLCERELSTTIEIV